MKRRTAALLMLLAGLHSPRSIAAQELAGSAMTTEARTATDTGLADGNGNFNLKSPALTGVRRPLYRLHKSDVVEVQFTFSPEFNQAVTVQPDGFVALKGVPDLVAEGLTVSELCASVRQAYQPVLRDPEVSVILKDFEKPYFLAGGQVGHPGKYELRSPTSVAEAVAIAGGFTDQSKHSQVIVFRRLTDGVVESHVLNLKAMLAFRNLEEDLELKPGDMLFVPQNRISKIRKYLPASSLSTFFTPAQF
jgi:polysaccharide export outer membrane protein